MKLIVGLGNPGIEYQFTPHNLGFLAIDAIAGDCGVEVRNRQCRALTARAVISSETVLLAKPETFMNLSGISVRELVTKNDVSVETDLIVIHDELDFEFGAVRIQRRRSSAGHNGVESIIGALATQDFLRIRLGVAPEHKVEDGMSYLLSPMFDMSKAYAMNPQVRRTRERALRKPVDEMLDATVEAVKVILSEGEAAAMNKFNRKAEPEG